MLKNNSFLYSLILLFIINTVLLFVIHISWNNSVKLFFPIQKELSTIRNDITEAHLWFEEMLSGDKTIDIEKDILIPFEHLKFEEYINTLDSKQFAEQEVFIRYFKTIDKRLDDLYVMALDRLEYSKTSGIGSAKDQEFDYQFKFCLVTIDNAITNVHNILENEIDSKNTYFKYVFIFFIITNAMIFMIMFIIKQKNSNQDRLMFEQTKLASMGEMIGNIAHQWRQPLSVISTGVTGMQLQKQYDMLSDDIFNTTCDSINKNAQYLSQTIDDFKNYIKGDTIKVEFNLKDEISSFLSLIDASSKSLDLEIILNIDDAIVMYGHKNELIQSLINLFNNSKDAFIQYNEIEDKYIFISAKMKKNYVELRIKDNAGGISSSVLKRMFEPYFTTKHKSQGTGLGLHMTYNLITNGMQGEIKAKTLEYFYEDKKFKGAEFTITLPIK